ncbi:hypothetical protein PanWU01x14_011720 [Parasponia andersonii]|uniref:Uncharacterized protein n=1 Tax=Parasponia andersonii TaxID=3476 RepID=A0A2P5E1P6_PARAD|nr:hypothetical protein PanWU01x14_011720 [Parasponia andersonii]
MAVFTYLPKHSTELVGSAGQPPTPNSLTLAIGGSCRSKKSFALIRRIVIGLHLLAVWEQRRKG